MKIMTTRILIQLLLVVSLMVTPCFGAKLSEMRDILIKKGQPHYFPAYATYKAFPDVCNKNKCFTIVLVDYVSESLKGMRRLAIFSSGKYLGCYSGLDELPVGVKGNKIKFKKSEFGDTVEFQGIEPPKSIWIDGAIYKFDPALYR